MHVSTAAIGAERRSVKTLAYGPTHNFPSSIVARHAVLPARSAPDLYPGHLNGADYDHAVTAPEPVDCSVAELDDFNRAPVKSTPGSPAVPCFDADQLNGFGDQAAALVDALKSANRQDLDKARQAFASWDFHRLLALVHDVAGYDTAAIRTAYAYFHDEATALDTALEQHPT
ncbi:hypothetical protein EOS_12600 [Caballeronia mineralivorans PML1(12)]|uniref:Uncharacterized protein n=1 Tax=Caballeronia mineralivorans PML1(12) TaxID=908627 RepID=A0A0J1CZD2_9BURK|nr:hypothetical protein [Caballeronia mineralivorans]KLU25889.1 hypothetical protein EOS_12600 [Caballeronia mineralivorans PML1(12)]